MKKHTALFFAASLCFLACSKPQELQKLDGLKSSLATATATGTVYYVDPDGNDSNAGTSDSNAWKTIAKVNTMTFSPGDQILFKSGGVWNDTLRPKGSGSAGQPIIIDKYGGEARPVINGGGKVNNSKTLLLNRVSFWEVNNLEITNTVPAGTTYAATGIMVDGGNEATPSSNITIKNCYVHDVNAAKDFQTNFVKGTGGIIIAGKTDDVLVQSCHIKNCAVEGMRTVGTGKNIVFDNNLLEYIYGDGIVMAGATGGCKVTHNTVYKACMNTNSYNYAGIWTVKSKNTLVAYNEVYGMTGGGGNDGMAFDADGYDANSPTDGDIFEYNYSHDNNGGFMLFMYNSHNITVRYNVSVNDIGTTGKKKLFLFNGSTNNNHQIYNNVFYIINPGGTIFHSAPYGTYSNNIIYAASTATGLTLCRGDNGQSIPLTTQSRFYNNDLYPGSVFTAFNWGTATRSNNFYDDPRFVNPGTGIGFPIANGYNIGDTSRCRNAGIFIANNGGIDFAGNSLPTSGNPDVGAFQHAVISQAGSSLADAYVRDGSYAGTNYGADSLLVVKSDATSYARRSYLKFNFNQVGTASVNAANLSIYCAGTGMTNTVKIYSTAGKTWAENAITWNNAPKDTTLVGQVTVNAAGWYNMDVTSAVNRELQAGSKTVSLLLMNTGPFNSNGYMTFYSKEAPGNKPVLQLTY